MKITKAYALIDRTELKAFDGRLPIFWKKEVAREYAKKYDCRVIKVEVTESPIKEDF